MCLTGLTSKLCSFLEALRETHSLLFPAWGHLYSLVYGPLLQPQRRQYSIFKFLSDPDLNLPASLFHFKGLLWLQRANLNNPGYPPYFKVSQLPILIAYTAEFSLALWCNIFTGFGHQDEGITGAIILPRTGSDLKKISKLLTRVLLIHCNLTCLFVLPGNSVKYDSKINPVCETLIKEALEGFYYIIKFS